MEPRSLRGNTRRGKGSLRVSGSWFAYLLICLLNLACLPVTAMLLSGRTEPPPTLDLPARSLPGNGVRVEAFVFRGAGKPIQESPPHLDIIVKYGHPYRPEAARDRIMDDGFTKLVRRIRSQRLACKKRNAPLLLALLPSAVAVAEVWMPRNAVQTGQLNGVPSELLVSRIQRLRNARRLVRTIIERESGVFGVRPEVVA